MIVACGSRHGEEACCLSRSNVRFCCLVGIMLSCDHPRCVPAACCPRQTTNSQRSSVRQRWRLDDSMASETDVWCKKKTARSSNSPSSRSLHLPISGHVTHTTLTSQDPGHVTSQLFPLSVTDAAPSKQLTIAANVPPAQVQGSEQQSRQGPAEQPLLPPPSIDDLGRSSHLPTNPRPKSLHHCPSQSPYLAATVGLVQVCAANQTVSV